MTRDLEQYAGEGVVGALALGSLADILGSTIHTMIWYPVGAVAGAIAGALAATVLRRLF
jgi:hypothetical protein